MECVTASVAGTEVKSSLGGLHAHTIYTIEINDFGRKLQVERRFDDFNNLYSELARICGESNLPEMPKKQFFGSMDADTIEKRKPQLEHILQTMLKSSEAMLERQNMVWNFLDLPLAAVCCIRFLAVEDDFRVTYLRQLVKIASDDKYTGDRYRLAHPAVMRELMHLLDRQLHEDAEDSLMELLKLVLREEDARTAFLENAGMGRLFVAAAKKRTLELTRGVFNTLIASSGEFSRIFCEFLETGMPLLQELCTEKSDEYFWPFLAKIIWISWEPITVRALITPHGLALLSTLFQSKSVVGRAYVACLLATGFVHGAFDETAGKQAMHGIESFVVEVLTDPPQLSRLTGLETLTRTKSSLTRLLPCLAGSEATARLALWVMARIPPKDGFLTPDLFRAIKRWAQPDCDTSTRMLTANVLLHIGVKGDPNGPTPWLADIESFQAMKTYSGEFLATEVARMEKSCKDHSNQFSVQKSRRENAASIPNIEENFETFKSSLDGYRVSRLQLAESLSMSEGLLKKLESNIEVAKHDLAGVLEKVTIPNLESQMTAFQMVNSSFEEQSNVEIGAIAMVENAAKAKSSADADVQKGEAKLALLREKIRDLDNARAKILSDTQALRVQKEHQRLTHEPTNGAIEKQIADKESHEQRLVAQRQTLRDKEHALEEALVESRKKWQTMSEAQVDANSKLKVCQTRVEEISGRKKEQQGVIEEKIRPSYNRLMRCQLDVHKCEAQADEASQMLKTNSNMFKTEDDERIRFLDSLRSLKEVISTLETSLIQMGNSG